jgi:DNA-binding MarR family transcriptional regulator
MRASSPATPAEDFVAAWESFFRAVRRAKGRAAARPPAGGLSLAQHHLLAPLATDGPLPIGALAEAAAVAPPTATRMLDGLVTAGRVERATDPADRRCVVVGLTDQGRDMVAAKREAVRAARRRIAAALTPEEREVAGPLLLKIAGALEEL